MVIGDNQTPLHGIVPEANQQTWFKWIPYVVAAVTAKTAYDKYNKKGIFKEVKADNEEEDN